MPDPYNFRGRIGDLLENIHISHNLCSLNYQYFTSVWEFTTYPGCSFRDKWQWRFI